MQGTFSHQIAKFHRELALWFCSILLLVTLMIGSAAPVGANPQWQSEWPRTDFTRRQINLDEVISGGPPKDGIPAIDHPRFKPASQVRDIGDKEPVISLEINGDARSYPVRILMFHEIVNDTVGGVPVAITYCPLCNAALVFERVVQGRELDFGTTGKLRYSDMIMYDRQSESWWQQFSGTGIVGELSGVQLRKVPSQFESYGLFAARHPDGNVLVPNNPHARPYGTNPYTSYDSAQWPFLYMGDYEGPVEPLERVVAVGDEAWPLTLVAEHQEILHDDLVIRWQAGQNSALDKRQIDQGRDIGTVTVTRKGEQAVFHLPFAFAFLAFNKSGIIYADVTNGE